MRLSGTRLTDWSSVMKSLQTPRCDLHQRLSRFVVPSAQKSHSLSFSVCSGSGVGDGRSCERS